MAHHTPVEGHTPKAKWTEQIGHDELKTRREAGTNMVVQGKA